MSPAAQEHAIMFSDQPQIFDDEDDFEDVTVHSETIVFNVSPFPARLTIASVPGSAPRKIRIPPGAQVSIPTGYTKEFKGDRGRMNAPWIETHTEREAWPGRRVVDASSPTGFRWITNQGPRIPQCVTAEKVDATRARWAKAMVDKEAAERAPLRMQLQAQDGRSVDVDVEVTAGASRAASGTPRVQGRRQKIMDDVDLTEDTADEPPDDLDAPPSADPDAGGRKVAEAQTATAPVVEAQAQPEPVVLPTTTTSPTRGRGR